MFLKTRIGKRMTLLVAVSVFLATLFATCLMAVFQLNSRVQTEVESLGTAASIYATAISPFVESRDKPALDAFLKSYHQLPLVKSITVLGLNDVKLAQFGSAQSSLLHPGNPPQGIWAALSTPVFPITVDILRDTTKLGKLVLISDFSSFRLTWFLAVFFALTTSLIASALAVIATRSSQERVIRPIVMLTEAMRNVNKTRNYKSGIDYSADDETGVMIGSYNSMIADIRSRDMALQKLAFFDPLTGLPNRPNFQQTVDEYLQKGTKAAVFHLDIDGFREINDALGHSIGDALLMEIAARLYDEADNDINIFRLGGDEFMILAPGVENESKAQKTLARFFAKLYQPLKILSHEVHISATAGALLIPQDGSSSGEVMRHSDLALIEAKKLGPGRMMFFRQQMDDKIQSSTELIMGLKQAIQKHEFQVFYQPQVDMATGKANYFEALVRWNHSTKGFISPGLFIPVAERAGLVPQIGRFVLDESCKQARAWFNEGRGMRQISVNVSAAQLLQTDFVRQVQEAINESGLPPPLLCLELTESVFLGKSVGAIRHILTELKDMGIDLALDDFGTGYSSLSYLEGLPFDKLKIDRSFVYGAHNSPRRKLLLGKIIEMAHLLNMRVVAEGAETLDEVDMLKSLNADLIQGYYFAKPGPAVEAISHAMRIERNWVGDDYSQAKAV